LTTTETPAPVLPNGLVQDIQNIAANRIVPSSGALSAYIADLERDIRNLDFRLQYLYHHRLATLELLASAKSQVVQN
jgi:hypothetical protein